MLFEAEHKTISLPFYGAVWIVRITWELRWRKLGRNPVAAMKRRTTGSSLAAYGVMPFSRREASPFLHINTTFPVIALTISFAHFIQNSHVEKHSSQRNGYCYTKLTQIHACITNVLHQQPKTTQNQNKMEKSTSRTVTSFRNLQPS